LVLFTIESFTAKRIDKGSVCKKERFTWGLDLEKSFFGVTFDERNCGSVEKLDFFARLHVNQPIVSFGFSHIR